MFVCFGLPGEIMIHSGGRRSPEYGSISLCLGGTAMNTDEHRRVGLQTKTLAFGLPEVLLFLRNTLTYIACSIRL